MEGKSENREFRRTQSSRPVPNDGVRLRECGKLVVQWLRSLERLRSRAAAHARAPVLYKSVMVPEAKQRYSGPQLRLHQSRRGLVPFRRLPRQLPLAAGGGTIRLPLLLQSTSILPPKLFLGQWTIGVEHLLQGGDKAGVRRPACASAGTACALRAVSADAHPAGQCAEAAPECGHGAGIDEGALWACRLDLQILPSKRTVGGGTRMNCSRPAARTSGLYGLLRPQLTTTPLHQPTMASLSDRFRDTSTCDS